MGRQIMTTYVASTLESRPTIRADPVPWMGQEPTSDIPAATSDSSIASHPVAFRPLRRDGLLLEGIHDENREFGCRSSFQRGERLSEAVDERDLGGVLVVAMPAWGCDQLLSLWSDQGGEQLWINLPKSATDPDVEVVAQVRVVDVVEVGRVSRNQDRNGQLSSS